MQSTTKEYTVTCTKRALRREQGYPIGQPAPMFILCGCGAKVEGFTIDNTDLKACTCGITYDSQGWILEVRP